MEKSAIQDYAAEINRVMAVHGQPQRGSFSLAGLRAAIDTKGFITPDREIVRSQLAWLESTFAPTKSIVWRMLLDKTYYLAPGPRAIDGKPCFVTGFDDAGCPVVADLPKGQIVQKDERLWWQPSGQTFGFQLPVKMGAVMANVVASFDPNEPDEFDWQYIAAPPKGGESAGFGGQKKIEDHQGVSEIALISRKIVNCSNGKVTVLATIETVDGEVYSTWADSKVSYAAFNPGLAIGRLTLVNGQVLVDGKEWADRLRWRDIEKAAEGMELIFAKAFSARTKKGGQMSGFDCVLQTAKGTPIALSVQRSGSDPIALGLSSVKAKVWPADTQVLPIDPKDPIFIQGGVLRLPAAMVPAIDLAALSSIPWGDEPEPPEPEEETFAFDLEEEPTAA